MVRTGHDALNIFMSNVQFITPQILHVDTGTMYEIGSLFIRMQEFYECPDERFRGKYFTLDEYMDWYAGRHPQGKFSYFEDWAGFNIPGSSLIKFWNVFTEKEGILRPKEAELFTHINAGKGNSEVFGRDLWYKVNDHDAVKARAERTVKTFEHQLPLADAPDQRYPYHEVPVAVHGSVWDFYKAVGYDHKAQQFVGIGNVK